jgi:hypothetical protein
MFPGEEGIIVDIFVEDDSGGLIVDDALSIGPTE